MKLIVKIIAGAYYTNPNKKNALYRITIVIPAKVVDALVYAQARTPGGGAGIHCYGVEMDPKSSLGWQTVFTDAQFKMRTGITGLLSILTDNISINFSD